MFIFIFSSFCVMIHDKSIRRNKLNKFPHLIAMGQTLATAAQNMYLLYLAKHDQMTNEIKAYPLIEL